MVKVLLASNNKIKENAIKKWFRIHFKGEELEFDNMVVDDSLLPKQPINTGGMFTCTDRISYVEKNTDIANYDYIISIENSLKIMDNEIVDFVNVCIKNCLTENQYEDCGQEVTINYKILEKYPLFIKIVDDLYKNYEDTSRKFIYDGCELTLGEIINNYYPDIPKNNWMKFICNKDRELQIYKVLNKFTSKIKNDINKS
jgi:non-canonical (house-cleaning) NTP pyrophosphatase